MTESPRRLDLRLTIPAYAPYRDIAVELAVKFAEYAGVSPAAVADVSRTVSSAAGAARGAYPVIDIELASVDGELVVSVHPSTD
jgi:hypothetical protein